MLERDKNGNPVEKQKPISSVKVGDLVYSYDEQTGQMGWYPVTDTISHTDEVVVSVALQIGLEHNEILSTTPEHPFYVTQRASLEVLEQRNLSKALENLSQKWIPASDLEIGDTVLTSSGQTGRVTLVRAFEKTQKMYNLEVARAETFSVGSRGWVVHNTGPGTVLTPRRLTDAEKYQYRRPKGFRSGIRDKVWDAAEAGSPDGKVRDPLTGAEMSKSDPWDMGHKPGYEFRKHRQSGADRGITRKQFLTEHNDPCHFTPELPTSNQGHTMEDMSDDYYGP